MTVGDSALLSWEGTGDREPRTGRGGPRQQGRPTRDAVQMFRVVLGEGAFTMVQEPHEGWGAGCTGGRRSLGRGPVSRTSSPGGGCLSRVLGPRRQSIRKCRDFKTA